MTRVPLRDPQRSLRVKLLAIVAVTTGTALVVAGAILIWLDIVTYTRDRTTDYETQADTLALLVEPPLTFDDAQAATEYLAVLRTRPTVIEAVLLDAQARTFATYRRDGALAGSDLGMPQGTRLEGDDLWVRRDISREDALLGSIVLHAEIPRRARLLRGASVVALTCAGSLAGTIFLLQRLQGAISGPLLDLGRAVRDISVRQDFSRRVERRSDDEVGALVDDVNALLARIEEREASLEAANEALQQQSGRLAAARDEVEAFAGTLERRVRERTAELEAANKELEAFAYSVSHDLRTPLRSIDGFTLLLQKNHAAALDEKGRHYMDRVRSATQRMGHLIDDLLKLSRTVRADLNRRDVDLSEMAGQVARELRAAAPERRVDFDIAPGMRANVDPELMRSVLENLMGNAHKFTRDVEHARIEVGSTIEDGNVVFFVKDNGAGFDMQYASKLFGAFQRLHAATEFEGTGVGLANVQRIVSRHGGRISAEAAVGRGATFRFTLAPGASP